MMPFADILSTTENVSLSADLASAVLGGPTGHELREEAFKRAHAYVADVLGEEVSS